MSQRQELPWDFLSGTYPLTNIASADDLIVESDAIPPGMVGVLRDTAVVFTTTGGGVYFSLKRRSGGTIRITQNFTANASGFQAVAVSGDKIQLRLSETGVGIVDISIFGHILENINVQEIKRNRESQQISFTRDGL